MSTTNGYKYTLHYWPTIPGRGEFPRLAFEAAGVEYTDSTDVKSLQSHVFSTEKTATPPHFAPPILEIEPIDASEGGKRDSKALKTKEGQSASDSSPPRKWYLSQTPAILAFLGQELDLLGYSESDDAFEKDVKRAHVNQLVLTILDLANEIHDVHHPIDVSLTYEEQVPESKRRSHFIRNFRIPKFLGLFQQTISSNPTKSGYLLGERLTVADLTLFQVLEGILFAFPKLGESLKSSKKYDQVFELQEKVTQNEGIKKYLQSGRRREFSMGLFRFYPELDAELEA